MKSIPAKWHHDLNSTVLVGYKKGEHLIISSIYTGTPTKDAVIKYYRQIKITSWDKPYTETFESNDKKIKEVLTVTLYETNNPREMKAEFEHLVVENGVITLKFSGITILTRIS